MKFAALLVLALFCLLLSVAAGHLWPKSPPTKPPRPHKPTKPTKPVEPTKLVKPLKPTRILTPAQAKKLAERVAAGKGCNANVCFAIDGSGSIPPGEFQAQKNFVLDLVSIISVYDAVEVAAVQYSTASWEITPLTTDIEHFNLKVSGAVQQKGRSFLAGGMNYCYSQLWRRRIEPIKFIMLGDGFDNIDRDAIARANLFRRIGGEISVVSVGFADNDQLFKFAGRNPKKVFDVFSFYDNVVLREIIEDLVKDVCGLGH